MTGLLELAALRAKELTWAISREVSETVVSVLEFPVVIMTLRGPMRGGTDDEDLTLLYVGRQPNLAHFKRKFFKEVVVSDRRTCTLLTYRRQMQAAETAADMVIVDIGWPYTASIKKRGGYLEVPDWIFMSAPLEETWDATVQNFRKTMRKNIKRLIRKNGYRCEATTDPAAIKAFYPDYYEAFIKTRYPDEVVMTPRIQVEQCARNGVILQVIGEDGTVAAGVYFERKGEFCLLVSGMPAELVAAPPEAAVSALYYFSMEYAFQKGFKSVNFLGTRAFADDGLLQFKRKWGAQPKDEMSPASFLIRPAPNSERAARFCERFPVLARTTDGLELVLCSTAPVLEDEAIARMLNSYHCDGLDQIRLLHIKDGHSGAIRRSAAHPTVQIVETSPADFPRAFTKAQLGDDAGL